MSASAEGIKTKLCCKLCVTNRDGHSDFTEVLLHSGFELLFCVFYARFPCFVSFNPNRADNYGAPLDVVESTDASIWWGN